jgi:outer membrane protein OmpU
LPIAAAHLLARATSGRSLRDAGATVVLLAFGMAAPAQTSGVMIYGTIDVGVTRVSNIAGDSTVRTDDSISQGNRLGFRGREDLGDGLEAFFNLEQGFAADTGTLRQGGLGWGRMAIVGLSHRTYGELSLGRQFDQMSPSLLRFHPAGYAGIYAAAAGDADRVSGNWLNNLVTYKSPLLGGFKFNAQYSLREDGSSTTNAGRAFSFGSTYTNGAFSAGAAVTDIRGYTVRPGASLGLSSFLGSAVTSTSAIVLAKYRTAGLGAGYTIGQVTFNGIVTKTRFETNAGMHDDLTHFALPVVYRPSDPWVLEASFAQSRFEQSRWRNYSLIADYYLSKRTDVYASANLQDTSGPGTSAVLVTLSPSSSGRQSALRLGIRHRF